ncbi:MAG: PaaI family thioesterase [Flavobacteriaceae bacterium]|nr:PaaI family thioesterase [Flavobacteriaceae bacterium]
MGKDFEKYLKFHRTYGGTGKMFKFNFIEYKKGFLKLEGEFTLETLNPNQSVQGGQMTSMLDDVTSLLIIYESKGAIYPTSTNLHSIHHRPLFAGKVFATAEVVNMGKNIATLKGKLFNSEEKLATTLMHSVYLIKKDFKV